MCSFNKVMRRLLPLGFLAVLGCAAFTNPSTWPSIPVRRLPDEMLGKSRDEQLDIPQALLRQERPKDHKIDAGDILGVVFPGVFGLENQAPPISLPTRDSLTQNIGVGFPIPVLEDGTMTMPLLEKPIDVRGLTVAEAQAKIKRTYIDSGVLKEESAQINKLLVTLYRPRVYEVLVIRQDSGEVPLANNSYLTTRRGSGVVIELPVYENDVLTALTRSGGLPGNDAKAEAIIQRGALKGELATMPPPNKPIPGLETIHIPLRLRPGEEIPFKPADIILKTGDIVFVQSRETEVFYTSGLIPTGEWPIPRNYDLDVLTAIAFAKGPLTNGGINFNNLNGNIINQGLGSPSPSQLTVVRRAPGKRQVIIRVDLNRAVQDPRERLLVQPGDILILQETMGEAFTRYVTTTFRFPFLFNILRTSTSTINSTGVVP